MRGTPVLWVVVLCCFCAVAVPERAAAQALGPILDVEGASTLFDTVRCGTVKCGALTFRNTGDTVVTVTSVDSILAPFSGTVPPFTLDPGASRSFTLCYHAGPTARLDSQRVGFVADTRVPLSVALLFDVSGSMSTAISGSDPTERIVAARQAGMAFVGRLRDTTGFLDEAAVLSFSTSFTVVRNFATDATVLNNAIQSLVAGGATRLYSSIIDAIDFVRVRGNRRIVVVLTDGVNTVNTATPAQVIAEAVASGVAVFTIGIGEADPAVLTQIATQTGGRFFSASTATDLVAIYRQIVSLLSKDVPLSFLMSARTVEPRIAVSPTDIDFGALTVGQTGCVDVTVANRGDAPLEIPPFTVPSPFVLSNPPSGPIAPGDSIVFSLCFSPFARGFAGGSATIVNSSCATPAIPLDFRGVGLPSADVAIGPILRIASPVLDFDTVFCRTTKCLSLDLSNVGDTALVVRSATVPPPFDTNPLLPVTLAPSQSTRLTVCYRPPDAPRIDTADLAIRADTRVPLSLGLLFDVSGSMASAISGTDNTPRISAARAAGQDFVSSLVHTPPEFDDEAAVFSFSNAFAVRQDFTDNKTLLVASIQSLAAGGGTRLYSSIVDAVARIAVRVQRHVLIVLTDGVDNLSTATPADAIAAAVGAGVTVFTIGIGEADATVLTQIATQTGGRFFSATTTTDLVAVYRQIATILSQNTEVRVRVRGRGVSPYLVFDPAALSFDSTKVRTSRCVSTTVRNTGDAPLEMTGTANANPAFTLRAPVPVVPPGGSVSAEICFAPTRLRVQTDTMTFSTNSCIRADVPLALVGIGYDSVTVALTGAFVAKPGSTVGIPVRLLDTLPAVYDVRSYSLSVRYRKTLLAAGRAALHPADLPVLTDGTLSAALAIGPATETVAGDDATLAFAPTGPPIVNPGGDTALVRLSLLALLGDRRTTDVRIAQVTFADGNPRVGVVQPAQFSIDSLCFLDARLLDPSNRNAGFLTGTVPNPFSGTTRIAFTVREENPTVVTISDAGGRLVRVLYDAVAKPGDYETEFDGRGLPAGMYLVRLTCGAAIDVAKAVLVR